MHGWLIYSEADVELNQSFIDWFIDEARYQNLSLELMIREEMTIGIKGNERIMIMDGQAVSKPDFAVVRTTDSLLSLHLESCGIIVFNSSDISRICNDKALTHHYINDLGIPMVDTFFYKKDNIPKSPPLAFPFVVKETSGRGGKQVYFIEDQQEWNKLTVKLPNDFIIQSSHVKLGKDLRVFIIGKEIVGAILRESNHDFRANFKLGGSARLYDLNEQETATIRKIINHFHFDMVGIDFLIDLNGGLLFNEIEDVVGSRTLSAVSNINIVHKYVSHIKSELKKRNFH
ncbi:ATP-grasp domain-containing protein [Virgibacillus profundi]|uniref:ATP-grasp domain-containing protein n=1 Tax=Virgibacillus profundi TaxID=2024555 RepID=UPI001F0A3FDA|nr:hypothetical protein [Virgibacillus profundi]